MRDNTKRLLLVALPDLPHIGAFFKEAASQLGVDALILNFEAAFAAPVLLRKANWWLRGHRPTRLRGFSEQVVSTCRDFQPSWMLATGIAPINADALRQIGEFGVRRLNYLTDDPWNPAHRAPWFMEALPLYDHVFSPRRSVLDDLQRLGCGRVSYLPFACAPWLHFPEPPKTAEEQARFAADVVFVGGADRDRVPYIDALIRAGFTVALYGGYWDRYRETARHARGHADMPTLRKAIGGAKVALCLVRRANRDGHVMRSFEVPAIGACMLTEDTDEHRAIFGQDGDAVLYFGSKQEVVEKLRWLLAHEAERHRLKERAHQIITSGQNTYRDRLGTMLQQAYL